jgi:hypothetical protein
MDDDTKRMIVHLVRANNRFACFQNATANRLGVQIKPTTSDSSSIPVQIQGRGNSLQPVLVAGASENSPALSFGKEILPFEKANNLLVPAVGSHSIYLAGEMPVPVERGNQALLSRSGRSTPHAAPSGLQVQHDHNEGGTVPLFRKPSAWSFVCHWSLIHGRIVRWFGVCGHSPDNSALVLCHEDDFPGMLFPVARGAKLVVSLIQGTFATRNQVIVAQGSWQSQPEFLLGGGNSCRRCPILCGEFDTESRECSPV